VSMNAPQVCPLCERDEEETGFTRGDDICDECDDECNDDPSWGAHEDAY
jgi:hypothetical protein